MPPRELFGEFWDPADGTRVAGRLVISEDDHVTLELASNLRPEEPGGFEVAVMQGDAHGQPVTLFDGQEVERHFGGPATFR